MIIRQKPLDDIGRKLVESNNEHDRRLEAMSTKIQMMSVEIETLKKDKIRQRSMEF